MLLSLLPFGFLFIFITIFGTLLSLSSTHWLGVWAGLEINLLGFIPLLIYRGTVLEAESAIKYFIVQALGSRFLILGSLQSFGITLSWEVVNPYAPIGIFFLTLRLSLKLGAFPFHFWLPSVIAGLSWIICLTLATWQKVAPIFLIGTIIQTFVTSPLTKLILLIGSISRLIGGLGGINQTQIRSILAYSSIGHIGWMLVITTVSETTLKIYFLIYFITSLGLFTILWLLETPTLLTFSVSKNNTIKIIQIRVILILLSLGGLPPLFGFVGKWAAIRSLSSLASGSLAFPLILGSLLRLFYYLTLLFTALLSSSNKVTQASFLLPNTPSFLIPLTTSLIVASISILNLTGGIIIAISVPLTDFF